MDIKEFAKSISGKEYGYPQFTKEEIETAKENGFVVVYGCSDDLMEFEGAVQDEGGCLLRRINGLYKSRLYRIHHMMMCRCYTESTTNYEYYGGKGIKVCKEWHDFMNFYNWAINNGYSEKLTLDRKDGNKDYEPSNCRWATRKEQSNNISSNIIFEFNGRKMTMAEWSRELSINRNTLDKRIRNGWEIEKAFTEPVNKNYATRRKS